MCAGEVGWVEGRKDTVKTLFVGMRRNLPPFHCRKGEKVVLFHQRKFSTKGKRKVVERLPAWGKWNL